MREKDLKPRLSRMNFSPSNRNHSLASWFILNVRPSCLLCIISREVCPDFSPEFTTILGSWQTGRVYVAASSTGFSPSYTLLKFNSTWGIWPSFRQVYFRSLMGAKFFTHFLCRRFGRRKFSALMIIHGAFPRRGTPNIIRPFTSSQAQLLNRWALKS